MTENTHSPLPWHLAKKYQRQICNPLGFKVAKCLTVTKGLKGLEIPLGEAEANAALIVKCVNESASLHAKIAEQASVIEQLSKALRILELSLNEHDIADYGWGEENPWTMREWFDDDDRAVIERARTALHAKQTGDK